MTVTHQHDEEHEVKEGTASPPNGSPKTSPRWTSEGDLSYQNGVDLSYGRCFEPYETETQFYYIGNGKVSRKDSAKTEPEVKPSVGDRGFTSRQKLVLISCMVANLVSAACVSLQAPFYPAEAEKKGATASQYALVFGIFELVVFIVSPLYGKYIGKIGPKFLMSAGVFLTSACCILFGLLVLINSLEWFLALSFAVRIVEAMGQAAYLTGSFTIIAHEFPENLSSAFAYLEASFGVGLIVGPTIGGILYQAGGFPLPFAVMGVVLLFATVFTIFCLPVKDKISEPSKLSILHLLRFPSILIAGYVTFTASMSIGFLLALLEPHLRQFNLSPVTMGVMFVINGGFYAFTTPIWGKLCEKRITPALATGIGGIFLTISYLLLGPSPILPFDTKLSVCVFGLILHGLGIAAELVGSFSLAHRDAIKYGFPDDLKTYGLVSGYWTSVFALGAFIGPTIGGFMVDTVGFPVGSQLFLILHLTLIALTVWWLFWGQANQARYYSDAKLAKTEEGTTGERTALIH